MKYSVGIEVGSTRIKTTLIDEKFKIVSQGSFTWESRLVNGNWTYSINQIDRGVKASFNNLVQNYKTKYHKPLPKIDAMGVSAMMHGYLAFDKHDNLLVPFRTWRNTYTKEASDKLTKLFNFNIPQRYSIAHLYQAILNKEKHVKDIAYLTTLAGYIHYKLTGQHVLGIGDASGMFPIDSKTKTYNKKFVDKFDRLVKNKKYPWKLLDILPKVKVAGDKVGYITKEGLKFLGLNPNAKILMCPAEGDAGTGMVSTNSVRNHTGNVSAGTSAFAMIVTSKKLGVHKEIDMVTTPTGLPVAMVHTNNCSTDINAWTSLFEEILDLFNAKYDKSKLMDKLFLHSDKADKDANGITTFNYYSGEEITKLDSGKPLLIREPDAHFNLANFMKSIVLSSLATLKIGLDILIHEENIEINNINAHGGMFRTPNVSQRVLSAAIKAPVCLLTNAGEGGSFGIAILAMYSLTKAKNDKLEYYLDNKVFKYAKTITLKANKECVDGFDRFMKRYKKYLEVERLATKK